MSVPVEPGTDNRPDPKRRYVYSCPECSVPQMAPIYDDMPVVDKCINDECGEFFAIPKFPARTKDITSFGAKEDALEAIESSAEE